MTRRLVTLLVALFLPAVMACTDQLDTSVAGPDAQVSGQAASRGSDGQPDRAGPGALSVLTWNVYYGANLDVLLDESLSLEDRLATVIGQVQATDMPARAAAIAEQVAAARPHLVGLQEVAHWVYSPAPDVVGFERNFIDLLLDELDQYDDVSYDTVSRTVTLDETLGPVSLTESVVILARTDLETSGRDGGTFANNLTVDVGPLEVEITKGWASVDATLKGRTYRFVTTHLEPADVGPGHAVVPQLHQLQIAQASELLGELEEAEMPVILTGDLNSNPDGSTTDTYAMVSGTGFVDTWLVGRPRGDGYTANQETLLQNEESALDHRIDYVLYRDAVTADSGPYRGAVQAERVGEESSDRTDAGLWPSDHAGVLGVLRTEQSGTP